MSFIHSVLTVVSGCNGVILMRDKQDLRGLDTYTLYILNAMHTRPKDERHLYSVNTTPKLSRSTESVCRINILAPSDRLLRVPVTCCFRPHTTLLQNTTRSEHVGFATCHADVFLNSGEKTGKTRTKNFFGIGCHRSSTGTSTHLNDSSQFKLMLSLV